MPYEVVKDGDAWVCRKKGTSKVFGRHKSKAEALAQMRALYANEGKSLDLEVTPMTTDTEPLVYYGGSLKALDDSGRIGGHLVLFGDAENPDATTYKDFFTPETDFWAEWPAKTVVLYHHGLDKTLGPRRLGTAELKADDAGVWLAAQLALRDDYERKLFQAVKDGKMGLSSGSVSHLVRREKQSNGSHKVISWPIFEASITPTPGEPRTQAVALKALLDEAPITDEDQPVSGILAELFGEAEAAEAKAIESAVKRYEIRAGQNRPMSAADREAIATFLAARGDREGQLKALIESSPALEADKAEPQASADLLAELKAAREEQARLLAVLG